MRLILVLIGLVIMVGACGTVAATVMPSSVPPDSLSSPIHGPGHVQLASALQLESWKTAQSTTLAPRQRDPLADYSPKSSSSVFRQADRGGLAIAGLGLMVAGACGLMTMREGISLGDARALARTSYGALIVSGLLITVTMISAVGE